MKSKKWEDRKKLALERANDKCEKCGAPSQAVHHKIYPKDFEDDSLDNMQVLCNKCHYEIHKSQIHSQRRAVLFSDSVLTGKQHFRIDVKTAINETKYIVISELRADESGKSDDRKILIFEENLSQVNKSLNKAINFVKFNK
ncbi:MAG: HNH endonuclease [bacterium]